MSEHIPDGSVDLEYTINFCQQIADAKIRLGEQGLIVKAVKLHPEDVMNFRFAFFPGAQIPPQLKKIANLPVIEEKSVPRKAFILVT